ncbi:hypothetical protein [Hydrogenophaga sp. NFH-34]|uniref:hypothetical protein n=1 Tax=Hydrogenophaga sp. NFH-34 TaxID=2744446 RepID=UPI001F402B2D|nr:hypothetical protein [Hydrogenophaga sp. NFH-34]
MNIMSIELAAAENLSYERLQSGVYRVHLGDVGYIGVVTGGNGVWSAEPPRGYSGPYASRKEAGEKLLSIHLAKNKASI